jgi:tetratricopeptide (TPR) repeat protein
MKQVITLSLLLAACGDPDKRAVEKALRAGSASYHEGDLETALAHFQDAPEDHRLKYNAGVVLDHLDRLGEATQRFEEAAVLADSSVQRANAQYNLGHTWQRRATVADTLAAQAARAAAAMQPGGDITEQVRNAVVLDSLLISISKELLFSDSALLQGREAYRAALRNNPHDEDARYNLTMVQNTLAARAKAAEQRRRERDAEKGKELTQLARAIIARADSLVGRYAFDEALRTMREGLEREPALMQRKDYSDKLETVTKAARP